MLYFWINLSPKLVELIVKHILRLKIALLSFFISDRYCHHRSDNLILLLINVGPRNQEVVLLASAAQMPMKAIGVGKNEIKIICRWR